MLVIPLKRFIVSFLLIILTTGIIIYISITSQSGESLQLRIDTQNIFFWGIIAFLVQILGRSYLSFSAISTWLIILKRFRKSVISPINMHKNPFKNGVPGKRD
jgi:pyridoxine/pyridoxamine 5'-phosphate oxidase